MEKRNVNINDMESLNCFDENRVESHIDGDADKDMDDFYAYDDEVFGDYANVNDSREESESLQNEKLILIQNNCIECTAISRQKYLKNQQIERFSKKNIKTNNKTHNNNNKNNSNNKKKHEEKDENENGYHQVSSDEVDSIENSSIAHKYTSGKKTEKPAEEGLMFFQRKERFRTYSKGGNEEYNCNQNNSVKTGLLPSRFVKNKEGSLKDAMSPRIFDKRPPKNDKKEKLEKDLEKLDKSKRMEDPKKESLKQMKLDQQYTQQPLLQQMDLKEKQLMKMRHLKKLSKVLPEELGVNESVEALERRVALQEQKDLLPPKSPLACLAMSESVSKENILMTQDLSKNDSKIEVTRSNKVLEDHVYKELKNKISSFPCQDRKPSRGDAYQKQPVPSPNLSPEPSDTLRYYSDQHDGSDSEGKPSDLGGSLFKSIHDRFLGEPTSSKHIAASAKNMMVAAGIAMAFILWMVDLCPDSVVR